MTLKVISFNIRFENPDDGDHNWNYRKPILAEIVNGYKPDLLGTQEGREPQLRDLEKSLDNLILEDSKRPWITVRMYPTIYYNPKSVEVVDSGDIWLSKEPDIPGSTSFDSAFPRLATWIKGKHLETNEMFLYVNVHLDHVKTETRQEQIRVLLEEIAKIKGNLPVIISGDFNEGPSGGVGNLVKTSSLKLYDPWLKLGHSEEGTHHNFTGNAYGNERIDWFLLEDGIKCLQICLNKDEQDQVYPSDHFPVFCEIDL